MCEELKKEIKEGEDGDKYTWELTAKARLCAKESNE